MGNSPTASKTPVPQPSAVSAGATKHDAMATQTLQVTSKLEKQRQMLEKRQAFLQAKVDNLLKQAYAAKKAGDKRKALAALKSKALYEKQIEKLDAARLNLESLSITIQGSQMDVEILSGMREGAAGLAAIHSTMDADTVDDVRAQVEEQMDLANEISDAISRPIGDGLDDADLLDELSKIEEEQADRVVASMPVAPIAPVDPVARAGAQVLRTALNLPAVPTHTPVPVGASAAELAELAALEAQMA